MGGAEARPQNAHADWSRTGQEPYGEWFARIQGADVGFARHRSPERMLLPNLKCINIRWRVRMISSHCCVV